MSLKDLVSFCSLCLILGPLHTQAYQFNKRTDYILGGSIIGISLIDLQLQNNLVPLSAEQIRLLDPDKVFSIDQFATSKRSLTADDWSDYTHFASMALPVSLLAGSNHKQDLAIVGVMLTEAIGLNASLTILSKNIFKRTRPFAYNTSVNITDKQVRSARQSFVSGHTSNSATLGFFTAKVFSDLNPDSSWKPVFWTIGAGLPAVVGGLRVAAGKHFITDVISGYALGALIGYFIPELHRKSRRFNIQSNQPGMISLTLVLN